MRHLHHKDDYAAHHGCVQFSDGGMVDHDYVVDVFLHVVLLLQGRLFQQDGERKVVGILQGQVQAPDDSLLRVGRYRQCHLLLLCVVHPGREERDGEGNLLGAYLEHELVLWQYPLLVPFLVLRCLYRHAFLAEGERIALDCAGVSVCELLALHDGQPAVVQSEQRVLWHFPLLPRTRVEMVAESLEPPCAHRCVVGARGSVRVYEHLPSWGI